MNLFLSFSKMCLGFSDAVWTNSLFLFILITITLKTISHAGCLSIHVGKISLFLPDFDSYGKAVRNIYMYVLCRHKFYFSFQEYYFYVSFSLFLIFFIIIPFSLVEQNTLIFIKSNLMNWTFLVVSKYFWPKQSTYRFLLCFYL